MRVVAASVHMPVMLRAKLLLDRRVVRSGGFLAGETVDIDPERDRRSLFRSVARKFGNNACVAAGELVEHGLVNVGRSRTAEPRRERLLVRHGLASVGRDCIRADVKLVDANLLEFVDDPCCCVVLTPGRLRPTVKLPPERDETIAIRCCIHACLLVTTE